MGQFGSHSTDFYEILYLSIFFENLPRKFKLHENLTKMTGTLHADQYTCVIISRSVSPKIINVLHRICRDNQNTHFVFSKVYLFIFLFFNFRHASMR
jgi:hypothetical protein